MRLLIVTQKVDTDDENLGAFFYWFEAFARMCEQVVIVADFAKWQEFPPNMTVHSLGKEHGHSRLRRLWKFWQLFSAEYARADALLFHQIPEFVLAASPFLLSLRHPSALWYAHKSVTWKLKLAEQFVDYIFTSSEAGFRLPSKKVIYIGQAIHTDLFTPPPSWSHRQGVRILTVGRIAPVKNYEMLIQACTLLRDTFPYPWALTIVGGPLLRGDHRYLESLKRLVAAHNLGKYIHFQGPRPFREIPAILQEHDLFINLSGTGSLDKAVLEAMSAGLTVITANEAYRSLLPPRYFLERLSPEFLAERIRAVANENRPNLELRRLVRESHNLDTSIQKILSTLSQRV